jgi:glucose/arabinose dehydrogenase/cytochrome c5
VIGFILVRDIPPHRLKLTFCAIFLTAICIALIACSEGSHENQSAITVALREAPLAEPAPLPEPIPAQENLGIAPEYTGQLNSLSLVNVRDATLEQVLPPLNYPWAFEFINDHEILLTRIEGELLRIDLNTGLQTAMEGLPEIGKGFTQIGLLDIELDPNFISNQRIYFSFAKPHPESNKYHATEVATGVLVDNKMTQLKILLNSEEYGWAPSNFGGALEFDDNGLLYISIGDRGEDILSQRPDHIEGKILRINKDGSTPEDNPFINSNGYDPRIYVMGVRNAQGLEFDAATGLMFESEHGPLGGDEINIIERGVNYGWPTISYGNNYATTKPMGIGTHNKGMEQPIFYFLPSIATSAIAVYRGEMFSEWDGDILVGALRGEHIVKLDFDQGRVRSSEAILAEVGGRIRDIEIAADGSIYILSQTTGLYRLYRKAGATETDTASSDKPDEHPGKESYELVCSGCHSAGVSGAPVFGNYAQWKPIMAQPLEVTKEHVFNGYNEMPERGLCYICPDEQMMDMIDYMFTAARNSKK